MLLGAGVSLPHPAGGPLFAEVRDAYADLAGVTIPDDDPNTRRQVAAGQCDPRGVSETSRRRRLEEALGRAVAGTPGTGPNPVHRLAARILVAGGAVWTTNWDLGDRACVRVPRALMYHQRPGGLIEIEAQRSGHRRRPASRRLSNLPVDQSPSLSRRRRRRAVHVRGHQAAGGAQFNGMRGTPWGSLNLQVDRGQLGS